MSDWRRGYNAFGIISCSKGVLGENNCMGSIYKLENMQNFYYNPNMRDRQSELAAAICRACANPSLSDGDKINAVWNEMDPNGQAARELEAAKRQAETQAEIDAAAAAAAARKDGGRRSKKRPSARRRRSSKARKARKTRTTRRR